MNDFFKDLSYYERRLFCKILKAFTWSGEITKKMDIRNIDIYTMWFGCTGIVEKDGRYIVMQARDGGNPTFYGYGDKIIGVSLNGKEKVIGNAYYDSNTKNAKGVLLFNDSFGIGIIDIVKKYAKQLSIADKSIEIAMMNTRLTPFFSASTENAKNQINICLQNMYEGKTQAFYDKDSLGDFTENPLNEIMSDIRKSNNNLSDLIETRADIYSRFLIEIGVPMVNNTKRSQLISGEIGGINTLSLVNLKDMLDSRQIFCERFNALYNADLTVRIADEFLIETNENSNEEVDEE